MAPTIPSSSNTPSTTPSSPPGTTAALSTPESLPPIKEWIRDLARSEYERGGRAGMSWVAFDDEEFRSMEAWVSQREAAAWAASHQGTPLARQARPEEYYTARTVTDRRRNVYGSSHFPSASTSTVRPSPRTSNHMGLSSSSASRLRLERRSSPSSGSDCHSSVSGPPSSYEGTPSPASLRDTRPLDPPGYPAPSRELRPKTGTRTSRGGGRARAPDHDGVNAPVRRHSVPPRTGPISGPYPEGPRNSRDRSKWNQPQGPYEYTSPYYKGLDTSVSASTVPEQPRKRDIPVPGRDRDQLILRCAPQPQVGENPPPISGLVEGYAPPPPASQGQSTVMVFHANGEVRSLKSIKEGKLTATGRLVYSENNLPYARQGDN